MVSKTTWNPYERRKKPHDVVRSHPLYPKPAIYAPELKLKGMEKSDIPCESRGWKISAIAKWFRDNGADSRTAMLAAICHKLSCGTIIEMDSSKEAQYTLGSYALLDYMKKEKITSKDIEYLKGNFPSFFEFLEDMEKERVEIKRVKVKGVKGLG